MPLSKKVKKKSIMHKNSKEAFHDEYIKMIIAPMYVINRNEAEIILVTLYAKSSVE